MPAILEFIHGRGSGMVTAVPKNTRQSVHVLSGFWPSSPITANRGMAGHVQKITPPEAASNRRVRAGSNSKLPSPI